MAKTLVIKKCSCKGTSASDFQDKKYGNSMRVCNINKKKSGARCTICEKEHSVSESEL
jgi:hypothetical protein